jgi:4-amino-4-deoxy-L-arabinose transferase-like glycosyltransferase
MQKITTPHKYTTIEILQLTSFMLLCFFAFTYNLSEVPPYHADENFYVTSSRSMIESDDYITPTYNDQKRFAKPIIFYWLITSSYEIFGVNLFSARLVSAFFGTLCIPLVFMTACRLFDYKTAIISALLLPGCYLHFQIARWAITDMTLNFFTLSTFYFFIRGFQDKPNKNIPYYFAYICMGIGFMTKGPIAIIIPALVIGGFLITLRNWEELSKLRLGYGTIILAAIILPWFVTIFLEQNCETD